MNFRINPKAPPEFSLSDLVVYIPNHANNNRNHEDCEYGIVSSINESYVFVKFYKTKYKDITIKEALQYTAHACKRENLKHLLLPEPWFA